MRNILLSLVNRELDCLVINFPRKTPKILHFHFIPRPIGEDLGYTLSRSSNKHDSRLFRATFLRSKCLISIFSRHLQSNISLKRAQLSFDLETSIVQTSTAPTQSYIVWKLCCEWYWISCWLSKYIPHMCYHCFQF